MRRIIPKPYNFTKYSILDIADYLTKNGLKISFKKSGNLEDLIIHDYGITIDVPVIDTGGRVCAYICFDEIKQRVPLYEEGKKLYKKLKKLFSFTDEEWGNMEKRSDLIKDADKLDIKDYRKKE